MPACPSCSAENTETSKFCSECGAALSPEYAATVTPESRGESLRSSDETGHSSLSVSSQHGRFLPGTKVAERYRIVSLVGKGGMGEVYRADDLKLGHTVALKFLPKALADDANRLEYFHSEVRLTRQISHPNVCRVYDIGEVDGQHFLSMEYVDGEDLRVLLRRIGRLPRDKGVQIAQQLCAGLAAAHEKGVLHRDLKPANIMLDGRGQVRITDFGLAKLAEDGKEGEIAGTPRYMAPEQLARGETTIQSDLYSLGLILYELFTGEAVHKGGTVRELLQAHEESSPSQPSNVVDDMDPVVERAILRCLEKEPHERPNSAHAVAAALPGGDPLAAAVAAGETPSPQMVAAAGGDLGLSPRGILGVMIALLVLLPINCRLADETDPIPQAGLNDEPAVLAAEACRLITEEFGYEEPAVDEIHGLRINEDAKVEFWYRQNVDIPFVTDGFWGGRWGEVSRVRPDWVEPPWIVPGERGLLMDTNRRLQAFRALPPVETSSRITSGAADWAAWFPSNITGFRLTGGDAEVAASEDGEGLPVLEPVEDRFRTPPDAFDAVGVWTGVDPDSGEQIYVETAAFRGKPTYFLKFSQQEFEEPRDVATMIHVTDDVLRWGQNIVMGVYLCLLVGGVILAWHNLRIGRGDRRGALRLAGCVFCLETTVWLTHTRHQADLTLEVAIVIIIGISQVLIETARAWVWYIALEPFARRIWPCVLISWSRLLDGRWRNSLIGRDLLLGVLAGVCSSLLFRLNILVQTRLADSRPVATPTNVLTLSGTKELFGVALQGYSVAIMMAMFILLLLVLLRITLKTERRAIVANLVIATTFVTLMAGGNLAISIIPVVLQCALLLTVLVRLGFLALVVQVSTHWMLEAFPLTADADHWYFSHGLFAIAWVSGVALFGCYTSLGSRPVFAAAGAVRS